MTALAIEFERVRFSYPGSGQPTIAVDHWKVKRGERLMLMGASGSGKTTLLNLVCGMATPQQGEIRLLEQPFSALSGHKRDRLRAQHIGVVFQQFNLIPYLSVRENVLLANHFGGSSEKQANLSARIEHLLESLGIQNHLRDQRADRLSVGQQQRVAIARALLNSPELLVADEPTSALDADLRDQFIDLLLQCANESNTTVLFVSHDRGLASRFDRSLDISEINSSMAKPATGVAS